MTDKLFTFCGISELKGQYKVRFANDEKRVAVLEKGDHRDIRLFPLPEPMTKINAAAFIQTVADFDDEIAQITIGEFITTETARSNKTPKAKPAKIDTTDLELNLPDPFVVEDELEDEPF
jgi:hypothetical protein